MTSNETISFVILDAAKMGKAFQEAARRAPEHQSLYQGESEWELREVAPYLFPFDARSDFAAWLLREGSGQSWGTFIATSASQADLRSHLRRFLIVENEEGKNLYFRYYDPRVLRVILPTFEKDQLRFIFGPVDAWLVEEDKLGHFLNFSLHAEQLRMIPQSSLFNSSSLTRG
jgi:hypothetical protein